MVSPGGPPDPGVEETPLHENSMHEPSLRKPMPPPGHAYMRDRMEAEGPSFEFFQAIRLLERLALHGVGQLQIEEMQRRIGDTDAADLGEVRVLAMHPVERHARDARATRHVGGEADRARGLVQRVERTAERRGLLAGDRGHRLAAREALEVGERGRRSTEPTMLVGSRLASEAGEAPSRRCWSSMAAASAGSSGAHLAVARAVNAAVSRHRVATRSRETGPPESRSSTSGSPSRPTPTPATTRSRTAGARWVSDIGSACSRGGSRGGTWTCVASS